MNSIKESNQLAKEMCASGYRYLYGAKGQDYTSELVYQLHRLYPKQVPLEEALKDADKGYKAIDCSGFDSKVLGVGIQNSSSFRANAYKRFPVSLSNAREGMAIWKSGHIAYIGEGLKIYEAASTKKDMMVSNFNDRADYFTELLVVKGSALEQIMKEEEAKPKVKLLEVDGGWGPDTTEKTQMVFDSVVDGIISNQKNSCKEYVPNASEFSWEFEEDCENGSLLIKKIQEFLAEKGYYKGENDGWCGPKTVEAIQKFLKDLDYYTGEIDKKMGPKTVTAWQKYINSRLK